MADLDEQRGYFLAHYPPPTNTSSVTPSARTLCDEDGPQDNPVPGEGAQATAPRHIEDLAEAGRQLQRDGFDERLTTVTPENLGTLDVGSVVLNKMVGTGIFTTQGQVLQLTGSKKISAALWVMGGIYTALCLTVYLELGTRFPHNGGELIYLDRTLKPGLMWALMFSSFFILIANTTANAIAFGKFIVIAGTSSYVSNDQLDPRIVKFIAIVAVSVVCLLHYFSQGLGRLLNKLLALYKLGLLIAVIGAEAWVTRVNPHPFGQDKEPDQQPAYATSNLAAVVIVLYSFTGWENANYVAGEIRKGSGDSAPKILKRGAYTAVAVVTLFYFLVSLLYYLAFDYASIIANLDVGIALNLGPKAFKPHGISLEILFAISALGNIFAVVFTSAKVKQSIARQRVLPFWRFLERDVETPKGGLVLHWICTTIFVSATPVNADGYTFVVGLYTYGQIIVVTVTTIGLLFYIQRYKLSKADMKMIPLKPGLFRYGIPVLIICTNILILIMGAASFKHSTQKQKVPRWLWPTIVGSIFTFGLLYWTVIRLLLVEKKSKKSQGEDGDPGTAQPGTWGEAIGVGLTVREVPDDVGAAAQFDGRHDAWARENPEDYIAAIKDGTRRRVYLELSGVPEFLVDQVTRRMTWVHTKML